jgi:hypothetical protein
MIEKERDLELENIVGNLMIAQYQVDKLRYKLTQMVEDGGAYYYRSFSSGGKKTSAHTFRHNGKWYKVSIKVEHLLSLDSNNSNDNNNRRNHEYYYL